MKVILNGLFILSTVFNINLLFAKGVWDSVSINYPQPTSFYFSDSLTGWICGESQSDTYLVKTEDGGKSWKPNDAPLSGELITGFHFINKDTGYAFGTSGLLLYTDDKGEHWKKLNKGITGNINSLSISKNQGVITTKSEDDTERVYHTANGGDKWELKLSKYHDDICLQSDPLKVSFISSNGIWLSNWTYSSDNGVTWTDKNNKLTSHSASFFLDSATIFLIGNIMTGSSTKSVRLYYFYKSKDNGITWTSGPPIFLPVKALHFCDELNGWFISEGNYVFNTEDGGIIWLEQKGIRGDKFQFINGHFGWVMGDQKLYIYKNNTTPVFYRPTNKKQNLNIEELNLNFPIESDASLEITIYAVNGRRILKTKSMSYKNRLYMVECLKKIRGTFIIEVKNGSYMNCKRISLR